MFSPYYARAIRRGGADPADHCAINVALYGPRGKHWTMTERRRTSLRRSARCISVGRSGMSWDGHALTVDIDELAIPRLSRLRGRIRIEPEIMPGAQFLLDDDGRHVWRPVAPRGRAHVAMDSPRLDWRGSAYFDCNFGAVPLERDFESWTWSRAETESGAAVVYDVVRRRGAPLSLALEFDHLGRIAAFEPPPVRPLPRTGWRIGRDTRSETPDTARVVRTLEDTPFYARSIVAAQWNGRARTTVHESLSLDRFRSRWVQTLLPFRMPRAFR